MRILVNTRFLLSNKLEGIGLYTHEVVSRLVESYPQHEFVLAFDCKFDRRFVYGNNVIPVMAWPPARHPLLFYWWFEWSLPRLFAKYQCDAFLSPDGFTSLRLKDTHNVLIVHDLAYIHYPDHIRASMLAYYRRNVPKFVHSASKIVTISDTSFQDLVRHFPAAASKVTWTYNGVREMFKPLSPGQSTDIQKRYAGGKPYFIVLGSINPRKNLGRILRAYDKYRSKSPTATKLLVVGRKGWMADDIGQVLSEMSHREDVVFTGYLSDESLVEALAAAEALLYVSLLEGFGLPVVEAMACGTPVITSNRSAMLEIAKDFAITVDPENTASIAHAMSQISSDNKLRAGLIKGGLEHSASFTWAPMVEAVSAALGL